MLAQITVEEFERGVDYLERLLATEQSEVAGLNALFDD